MQFLVYLTILMVSVSAILLELHWLTSPPPQTNPPVPIASASAPKPRPKTEGPNAELSPIYPKKPDTQQPVESTSSTRQPQTPAAGTNAPAAVETMAKAEQEQKPAVETTGAAPAETRDRQPVAATTAAASSGANNANAAVNAQTEAATSSNRCDVQACASAYRSFREADCTYQPFDGPRRFCEKAPGQRMAREQQPDRRKWSRDVNPRQIERTVRWQIDEEADDDADLDDDADRVIVIRRPGARW